MQYNSCVEYINGFPDIFCLKYWCWWLVFMCSNTKLCPVMPKYCENAEVLSPFFTDLICCSMCSQIFLLIDWSVFYCSQGTGDFVNACDLTGNFLLWCPNVLLIFHYALNIVCMLCFFNVLLIFSVVSFLDVWKSDLHLFLLLLLSVFCSECVMN